MKRYFTLLLAYVCIIALTSCSAMPVSNSEEINTSLASFSYEDEASTYRDGNSGVNPHEFLNVDTYPIENQAAAIDRAKNECTII